MRAILELVRSPCCCCLRDDAMVVSVGVVEFGVLDVAVFGGCVCMVGFGVVVVAVKRSRQSWKVVESFQKVGKIKHKISVKVELKNFVGVVEK